MKTIIIDGVEYNLTPKAPFKKGEQEPETIFLKFRIGDKVTNGEDTYTIDFIDKDCYWVKEHDCVTIPFKYQHHWELVEQKPTDKVEPKFKIEEGKWYVCISQFGNCIEGRVYKATSYSRIMDDYGTEYDMHSDAYKYFRLWTIQDAKEGDVLVAHECLALFKEIDGLNIKCYCTYHFMNNPMFFVNTLQNKNAFNPATKEQRDILFQKMKEAGYEWDAENKELRKIEQNFIDGSKNIASDLSRYIEKLAKRYDFNLPNRGYDIYGFAQDIINYLTESEKKELRKIEQNSAWSEEDEDYYDTIIEKLEVTQEDAMLTDNQMDFLKSLKGKIQPQVKQDWSEEDEMMLNDIIRGLKTTEHLIFTCDCQGKTQIASRIDWLKSLRERMKGE